MKFSLKVVQFIFCIIIMSSFAGCDSQNKNKQSYETLVFNVDETLLEPMLTDTLLNIKIAAPKNWKQIDNPMFSKIVDRVDSNLTDDIKLVPRWIFLNETSRAMCVVSRLNGIDIAPDETFLMNLTTGYRNRFPNATVKSTSFMKDDFHINQLMVIDTNFILIKLICHATETPVFEVDYNIPKGVYEVELKAIESSIGSIKLINQSQ